MIGHSPMTGPSGSSKGPPSSRVDEELIHGADIAKPPSHQRSSSRAANDPVPDTPAATTHTATSTPAHTADACAAPAPVSAYSALDPWALLIACGGSDISSSPSLLELREDVYTIGRKTNQSREGPFLNIRQPYVSSTHLTITRAPAGGGDGTVVAIIRDLSSNGTLVNDVHIVKGTDNPLRNGDIISFVFREVKRLMYAFKLVPAPESEAEPAAQKSEAPVEVSTIELEHAEPSHVDNEASFMDQTSSDLTKTLAGQLGLPAVVTADESQHETVSEAVHETVSEAVHETVSEAVHETVPEPGTVPETLLESIHDVAPESVSDGFKSVPISESVSEEAESLSRSLHEPVLSASVPMEVENSPADSIDVVLFEAPALTFTRERSKPESRRRTEWAESHAPTESAPGRVPELPTVVDAVDAGQVVDTLPVSTPPQPSHAQVDEAASAPLRSPTKRQRSSSRASSASMSDLDDFAYNAPDKAVAPAKRPRGAPKGGWKAHAALNASINAASTETTAAAAVTSSFNSEITSLTTLAASAAITMLPKISTSNPALVSTEFTDTGKSSYDSVPFITSVSVSSDAAMASVPNVNPMSGVVSNAVTTTTPLAASSAEAAPIATANITSNASATPIVVVDTSSGEGGTAMQVPTDATGMADDESDVAAATAAHASAPAAASTSDAITSSSKEHKDRSSCSIGDTANSVSAGIESTPTDKATASIPPTTADSVLLAAASSGAAVVAKSDPANSFKSITSSRGGFGGAITAGASSASSAPNAAVDLPSTSTSTVGAAMATTTNSSAAPASTAAGSDTIVPTSSRAAKPRIRSMKGTPGGDAELVLQMYKLQDESAVQEARIASLMSQVQQLTRDLYVARQDSEKHVLTISQLENQIMQMQRDHEVQMDLRQEQFQQLHQQMQQQMQSQTSRLASEPSEVRTIAVSASAATEDMRAMLAAYSSELETQSAILEARHRVLEDCTKALADERNLRLELEEANRNARAALATRDKTIVQLQTESSSLRSLLSSATHLGGGAGVISAQEVQLRSLLWRSNRLLHAQERKLHSVMVQLHDLHRNVSGLLSTSFAGRDILRDEEPVLLPSLEAGGAVHGRGEGAPTALMTMEEAVVHEALLQSLEKEHFPSRGGGGGGGSSAISGTPAAISEHDSLNHDDFARLISATVHGDFGDDGHDFSSMGSPPGSLRGEGGVTATPTAYQNGRPRPEGSMRSRLYSFDDPAVSWDPSTSSSSHHPFLSSHAVMPAPSRDVAPTPVEESGASYRSHGGGLVIASAAGPSAGSGAGVSVQQSLPKRIAPFQQQIMLLHSRSSGSYSGVASANNGASSSTSMSAPSRKRSRVDGAPTGSSDDSQQLQMQEPWDRVEDGFLSGVKETIAL